MLCHISDHYTLYTISEQICRYKVLVHIVYRFITYNQCNWRIYIVFGLWALLSSILWMMPYQFQYAVFQCRTQVFFPRSVFCMVERLLESTTLLTLEIRESIQASNESPDNISTYKWGTGNASQVIPVMCQMDLSWSNNIWSDVTLTL